jgi:hypothetical protein
MKDDLKITVIATGFRNDQPQRKERVVSAAQAAISTARTASAYQMQAAVPAPRAVNGGTVAHAPATRVAAPARENPSLATITESIKTAVEPDDLDVPAFIRKRGEIN